MALVRPDMSEHEEPILIRNDSTAVVICQDLIVAGVLYQSFLDRDQVAFRLVRH